MLPAMGRPPKAREPLRLAALELFVKQGVHATGVRDIARHAGVSEAALYCHWANKEDMVHSLFTEHLAEVVALLESAIATEATLAAQVLAACRASYRLYDEQPLVFRFVLLVQHELASQLPANLRMPQDVVIDLIRRAAARGEITLRGDADHESVLLSAALIGTFLEAAIYVGNGRLPGPLLQHADAVTRIALRILRA